MSEDPARFWMVHGTGPANHRHATYEDAKDEAKRLARLAPGVTFFVLEAVSAHVKIDVRDMPIELGAPSVIDGDEIPF